MAFENYSDEQLDEHLNEVLREKEKRARRALAPSQIYDIAARYIEDGGDPSALILPEV